MPDPTRALAFAAIAITLFVSSHSATAQEVITMRSGNGPAGSLDSNISFLSKGDGAIGPFSTADFAAARSGAKATINNSDPAYITSLPSDPAAKWIAVDGGKSPESALYAYDFQVNTTAISAASLDLHFAVDNFLGEPTVPGLYINGTALPGTNQLGDFHSEYEYTDASIGFLLRPGTNTLYFYQYDQGVIAASIFSARISVASTASSVPEPGAPVAALVSIVPAFLLLRRRQK